MSGRRRPLVATLLLVALPCAASQAQDAHKIGLVYEVSVAGLAGLRVEVDARFDGVAYDVESRAYKVGVLQTLTSRYEGHTRAWGRLADASIEPAGGALSVITGEQKRNWRAWYEANGGLAEAHDPPWRPQPNQRISVEQRSGSLDPLSATLAVAVSGDHACDRTMATLDGKRRIDVMLQRIGIETAAQSKVSRSTGPVLVCEARLRRIAGDFGESSRSSDQSEPPTKVWLARLGSSPFRLPARLEAASGWGTVRGHLLTFNERRLTPSERTAMLR